MAVALASFGSLLRGRKISIRSDSQAVVAAVHSGACTDPELMQLIRTILFSAATHQFAIRRKVRPAGTTFAAKASEPMSDWSSVSEQCVLVAQSVMRMAARRSGSRRACIS